MKHSEGDNFLGAIALALMLDMISVVDLICILDEITKARRIN